MKTRLQVRVQQQGLHAKEEHSHTTANGTPRRSQHNDVFNEILQILREDGVPGLYTGLESSVAGTASMNFAYFYWSAAARTLYQSILRSYGLHDSNSIMKEFGLGAAGGAMAQLCTNPIAVISTRQQTRKAGEEKRSMWETMMEIVQSEDGWTGLWRGFKVNLILVVNPMITYGVYQWLRGVLVSTKRKIGSVDAFRTSHALEITGGKCLSMTSARRPIKGPGDHCHSSPHSCKDNVAIEASTMSTGQAFPGLHRGPCLHCQERGCHATVQRAGAANHQGVPGAGTNDDVEGEVRPRATSSPRLQ